jgi:hypothetical protein
LSKFKPYLDKKGYKIYSLKTIKKIKKANKKYFKKYKKSEAKVFGAFEAEHIIYQDLQNIRWF